MAPCDAALDLGYAARMDAVFRCNLDMHSGVGPDRQDLTRGQSCVWMGLTLHDVPSPLSEFVGSVVRLRTEPEVMWIYAARIVAGVADNQAFGNWRTKLLERISMCPDKALTVPERAVTRA